MGFGGSIAPERRAEDKAVGQMDDYGAFLERKRTTVKPSGFAVEPATLNPMLFDWQRDLVVWALSRGKAALFAGCGLGKTPCQLVWADQVARHTDGDVLILAPLAVAQQTVREGQKFGVNVALCRTQADVRPGVNVTNYEMLHHFDPLRFRGIVADESSCLKDFSGKLRGQITRFARPIPFRLACTATPAPNDLIEIINHADFLSLMKGKEIIALFFTQDGNTTHHWRIKGHAREDWKRWLRSWSRGLRKPSDFGAQYDDGPFQLPDLTMHECVVPGAAPDDMLFPVEALTLHEQRAARRASLSARVKLCADLVNNSTDPWLIWCDLNAESEALAKAIPDAVEVRGSDSHDHKERALLDFVEGRARVLVSKPSICGYGMNFQHCAHSAFVGVSHSWEQFYQAVRRTWRFGQTRPTHVYVITSESEGAVVTNIKRKEREANLLMDDLITGGQSLERDHQAERDEMVYAEDTAEGRGWRLHLGDCVERIDRIESDSVGLMVTSPPFPSMYAYTNSARDMGNVRDVQEMLDHFRFLVGKDKLMRVMMPGRLVCLHLMQLPTRMGKEGYVGLHDYRGQIITLMQGEGWVYSGEVTIDKNPQVQAVRSKERGLLFKTLANDSSLMRMGLADYMLYFRKPGENPAPIRAGVSKRYNPSGGWITEEEWIEWAGPVWYRHRAGYPGGIRESNVLNVTQARETDDERHLAPLQLCVIERAVKLWSAPGELVLDPFNGIGSVGYMALQLGRRYVGIELKRSYFQIALRYLRAAEERSGAPDLFSWAESQPGVAS